MHAYLHFISVKREEPLFPFTVGMTPRQLAAEVFE